MKAAGSDVNNVVTFAVRSFCGSSKGMEPGIHFYAEAVADNVATVGCNHLGDPTARTEMGYSVVHCCSPTATYVAVS